MANTFQVKDAAAVMNALVAQATGQTDIAVVDHQSFIDAGTKVLATGVENTINSIAILIGELIIKNRPYTGKLKLITPSMNEFSARIAKIDYYAGENEESGAWNTDLNPDNLVDGEDNSSGVGDMWEVNLPKVVERFFHSESTWQKHYTYPRVQLQRAFRSEGEFISFWNGVITEVHNDIESTIESRNRALIADRIAGTKALVTDSTLGPECFVDLIKEFNDFYGTTYTRAQILSTHAADFLKYVVSRFKVDSDRMTERTVLYHDAMEDSGRYVLKHTPKEDQRLILYGELFTQTVVNVMPEIFSPGYLSLPQYESVSYWQSTKNRTAIKVTPALPDGKESTEQDIDYVVGILFDKDAIMSINQFDGAFETPLEARKLYTNMWYTFKFGAVNDYVSPAIVYYLGNGG